MRSTHMHVTRLINSSSLGALSTNSVLHINNANSNLVLKVTS